MFIRRVIEFVFSSPITMVASVVSIGCVGFLVVNIVSDIAESKSAQFSSHVRSNNGSTYNQSTLPEKKLLADMATGRAFNSSDVKKGRFNENDRDDSGNESDVDEKELEKSSNLSGKKKKPLNKKMNVSNQTLSSAPVQSSVVNDNNDENDTPDVSLSNVPSFFTGSTNTSINTEVAPVVSSPENNTDTVNVETNTDASNTETSITDTTSGDDGAAINTSLSDTKNPEPELEPELEPEPEPEEPNYPPDSEHEVKIDADETHHIFCIPVEPNGPPCMCTYTITNTKTRSPPPRLEDNCG